MNSKNAHIEASEKKIITRTAVGFDIRVTWLKILKMYNPLAQKYGLTAPMGFALLNINEEHGNSSTKIAPLLGMEPRSLTRMLKKLEEEEMIERKPDPKDGRAVRIFLTDKGKESKATAMKFVRGFNADIADRVSKENLEIFFDVLERIYEAADERQITT